MVSELNWKTKIQPIDRKCIIEKMEKKFGKF
jgi:hypothetical protein